MFYTSTKQYTVSRSNSMKGKMLNVSPCNFAVSKPDGNMRIEDPEVCLSLLSSETLIWQKGPAIGSGRFGQVYLGVQIPSANLLAVKQIFIEEELEKGNDTSTISMQHAQSLEKLEREADIIEHLDHPNIIRFLGTEKYGPIFNIFMEYLPAGSLSRLLKEFGPFDESLIRLYIIQVLHAFAYLHDLNIAHRDLKCGNLLLSEEGIIKLADFGTAKKADETPQYPHDHDSIVDAARSVREGIGSPFWMAPEIVRAEKGRDCWQKADIWGIGCVMIEMATAEPPWNNFSNPLTAMFHIASDHDKPFIPAHLSPEAHDFLIKCFDKNPNTRPTAQKLLEHPFVTNTKIQSELTSRPSDNAISGPGSSTIGSEDGLSWSSDESEPEDLSTYNPNRWPLTIKEMAFAIQWQKLVRKRHGKTAWFQLLHRWIARVRYRISLRENDISFWTSRSISARSNTIYDHISSVFTTKRSEASIGQSTSSKESNSSRESSSYEYIEPSDETSFSNDGANDSYSSSDDAEYSSSGSDDSSHEIDNHNSSHETDVIIFGTVRALADYKSTAANELSMREGDMIEILDVSSSGWWKARHVHKVRQIGWIPCTYVEWLQRTIDVTFKAVVKVPYSAQTSNELSLKKEEVVTVKRCDSRGHGIWFQGTKKSGENGWFPMECVQRV